MGLVVTALRKQHRGRLLCHAGRAAGLGTGTPGQARVLGAEELHHHRERLSARIMTKIMQFGIGLSSQINTILRGLEERENIQVPKQLGFGRHGCGC